MRAAVDTGSPLARRNLSFCKKTFFFERPEGVLLITPESLQALFCNHGFEIPRLFSDILYIVVDELHSFIGSEL
ncbi:MAG: hypothetical protein LBP37_07420 [Spirochaetaceae bacterium]|jgi:ATP-dependent Lhr-like helicase|nr:hypothetical protein [Spirochaetaceae bacterium]